MGVSGLQERAWAQLPGEHQRGVGGSGAHSQAPPGGRCSAPAGQGEPWLLPGLSQHGTSQCTGTVAREGFTCFPIIANVRKEKAAWLLPL